MIHFVPAWYNPGRPWYSTDSAWFTNQLGLESEGTVTQTRIFAQGPETAALVILNYAPSLRRYLHSQNILGSPYWSFFDRLQGLADDYTRPLDFLQLEWPDDVSFFYNPFVVTVMRGAAVYARVYLAREGTLQSIRYYGDGMPTLERIFDDRGFVSSVLMHDEDGMPLTQYYLSRAGDVIVSEDVPSGRVDIVQNDDGRFQKQSYDGWVELMREFLSTYLREVGGSGDTVVLALSDQHNDLVASVLADDQTLVLSRSASRPAEASAALLDRAGAVFADSGRLDDVDNPELGEKWTSLPLLSIYPLERRVTFGASANEPKVYISFFVDGVTTEDLDFSIAAMATQLVDNEHTRLLVCSFRSQDVDYLRRIRAVIAGYQRLDEAFDPVDDTTRLGVDVGITDGPEERIQLVLIDREADLIATMAKSRVLVDLGERVNRRLAAAAVDAGVPQINRRPQDLAAHLINGYTVEDESELSTALDYFLSGLEHWNQSLVQCRVLEDLFSAPEVLARWELVKEGIAYARLATRA